MNTQPVRRSRLVRQESKRLARQTILIIIATLIFILGFFSFGIPSLIKLAVIIGNSKTTSKFAAQEDKVAPMPPQINPLPEATASGSLNLEGLTESGAVVSLYQNTAKVGETTADNQGNFSFLDVNLEKDSNTFYATAADGAGNQSDASVSQTVTFDDQPPALTINSPTDGQQLYGELKQIIDITGTTDAEAQLTVNDRQIVVTGDGSFSTKYALEVGDNKLAFTAKDRAGNVTTKDLTVNFSK